MSSDPVNAQLKFQKKNKLPFILLADEKQKVITAFGVPPVKKDKPFPKRQIYLFKNGELVWRDLEAKTTGQGADIIKAIRQQAK